MVPPWGSADSKPDFCTAKDIFNNYSSSQPTSTPPPSNVPEWFYCVQTATLSNCELQCDEYCNNAGGKTIENCIVDGKYGCKLHGHGCEGPFYKCSCSVKCPS